MITDEALYYNLKENYNELLQKTDKNIFKNLKTLRCLEVDRRLILPSKTQLRLLITSADVLHS
jgi:heme/copper-type cytochrome/quinol oxidase subunit 2